MEKKSSSRGSPEKYRSNEFQAFKCTEREREEPRAAAIWRFFKERATRNPSADGLPMAEVRFNSRRPTESVCSVYRFPQMCWQGIWCNIFPKRLIQTEEMATEKKTNRIHSLKPRPLVCHLIFFVQSKFRSETVCCVRSFYSIYIIQ